jgi:lipoate---protein ligase
MSAGRERAVPGGRWRLLADDGAGAAEGLALDEALMARYARGEPDQPPTLRLYTYRSHCALVGRYQNLEAEVDLAACERTGTPVSRRPTGGGAIIMGAGQLGVAVTSRAPAGKRPREIIEELAAAVTAGLAELGITAVFRGKNDLEAGGRKIAGLGLYVDQAGAMLFHASVLADLDIPFMLEVLRIPAAKLADKAAAAVAQRVTTVTEQTSRPWDGAVLRHLIASGFTRTFGATLEPAEPDPAERALAATLATESWLGDRSMSADGSGSAVLKTPAGLARIYLTTHGDLVKNAIIVGDFNELPPALVEMESALRWRRLDERAVTDVVTRSGAAPALGVSAGQLTRAVLEAGRQAGERLTAAPVRAVGSCYFPEPGTRLAEPVRSQT